MEDDRYLVECVSVVSCALRRPKLRPPIRTGRQRRNGQTAKRPNYLRVNTVVFNARWLQTRQSQRTHRRTNGRMDGRTDTIGRVDFSLGWTLQRPDWKFGRSTSSSTDGGMEDRLQEPVEQSQHLFMPTALITPNGTHNSVEYIDMLRYRCPETSLDNGRDNQVPKHFFSWQFSRSFSLSLLWTNQVNQVTGPNQEASVDRTR